MGSKVKGLPGEEALSRTNSGSSRDIFSQAYADRQDRHDPLRKLRSSFLIPSRGDLRGKTIARRRSFSQDDGEPSTYLCGNSLGLQPALTGTYMQQYLDTWATKGVYGHFKNIEDSQLVPWLHVDDDVMGDMANVVGAKREEVAVMETLTANLHLMMASFYRPTKERWKIILEGKAFPSDHYAVESQIQHHGLAVDDAMILIEPPSQDSPVLPTEYILSVIDKHASETALLLLPGIQFYTGQYFDMPTITRHAKSKGIIVGWDLAHAAGNVPTQLHNWDIDFAVWCTYKYLNCGPGAIGGAFVHEKHGRIGTDRPLEGGRYEYRPRLSGWWGSSKSSRFAMDNRFHPIPGAGGFQLSNPSVADTTAVRASLDVFKQTSMAELRAKSLLLTKYLQDLLDAVAAQQADERRACFTIITPRNAEARGAQLSVRLSEGLLEGVMASLEEEGVVVDERRPDVIRIAPAPLYNAFSDVLRFVEVFKAACQSQRNGNGNEKGENVMVNGGQGEKGWSEVK